MELWVAAARQDAENGSINEWLDGMKERLADANKNIENQTAETNKNIENQTVEAAKDIENQNAEPRTNTGFIKRVRSNLMLIAKSAFSSKK